MSMLSAQVDELRELATRYDELQVGAVKAVTMPSDMGSILREAADTIWELRGSVHRERAEADRLREELADAPKCEACEAMLDCDECLRADGSHKERRRLSAENARLRSELESVGTAAYLYGRGGINDENAKLRELCSKFAQVVANDDVTFRKLREIAKRELGYDFIGAYDSSLGDMDQLPLFSDHMRELGVEV